MDLIATLKQPEGKTLEFKRDLSSPVGAIRTVTAFANTAGGVLLIGVQDRTAFVRGVADPLAEEERLANMIMDAVTPRIVPEIEILPWRNTHVLAVEVFPSSRRPHHITAEGPAGVYVRVGSTNRRADEQLITEMGRFARRQSYDEEPLPDLDSEAIDFRAASEYFSPIRGLKRGDLETLGLAVRHQRRRVPTVGGMLLFGKQKERHFPDAWVQAGCFQGRDRSRIEDHRDIRGHAPQLIDEALAFVAKHLRCAAEIGLTRRRERWSLPLIAIREAVVNAVAHADYAQRGTPIRVAVFDDRVEVESPGLLPFGLTLEELPLGVSKLRNRVIGRVFHELGLMENWGSGVQRMISACREEGCAPPAFEEIGGRFRVTLRAKSTEPPLDDLDGKLLQALQEGTGLSTGELAAHIGRTPRAARTRLRKLAERGLVREIGSAPNDPKRLYYRFVRS